MAPVEKSAAVSSSTGFWDQPAVFGGAQIFEHSGQDLRLCTSSGCGLCSLASLGFLRPAHLHGGCWTCGFGCPGAQAMLADMMSMRMLCQDLYSVNTMWRVWVIRSFGKQYGILSQRSLAIRHFFPQLPSIELQRLEQPIAQKLNLLLKAQAFTQQEILCSFVSRGPSRVRPMIPKDMQATYAVTFQLLTQWLGSLQTCGIQHGNAAMMFWGCLIASLLKNSKTWGSMINMVLFIDRTWEKKIFWHRTGCYYEGTI